MKEISLNILDIVENSVKAKATLTEIIIEESEDTLVLTVKDDGCGMSEETVKSVTNPFYTTRKTRKVGLGIPLLKLACEQTGGSLYITSKVADSSDDTHGTTVRACFFKNHLDYTPLGSVIDTMSTLIQGHPDTDFRLYHTTPKGEVSLDTREVRAVLVDIPLNSYEVIKWIEGFLEEQYEQIV